MGPSVDFPMGQYIPQNWRKISTRNSTGKAVKSVSLFESIKTPGLETAENFPVQVEASLGPSLWDSESRRQERDWGAIEIVMGREECVD